MTTTSSDAGTETPRRAGIAAAIAIGAHVIVVLAAYIAGRVVQPSAGGGMEDIAAAAFTLLGGEILVGLAACVVSMVVYRRGRRYTGLGLMGGWLGGLALLMLVQALA